MVSLKDHLKRFLRQESKLLPDTLALRQEPLFSTQETLPQNPKVLPEPSRSAVRGSTEVKAELSLRLLTIPKILSPSVSSGGPVRLNGAVRGILGRIRKLTSLRESPGEVSNLLKVLISWLPELPKPPTIAGVWEYQGFHNEAVPLSHDSRKDLRGFTSWYNPHPLRRRSYG